MRNSIYFHHIPKTAGTSVNAWLSALLDVKAAPMHLWGQMLRCSREELSQYELFAGHFYRPFHSYLGRALDTLVFLRNPIDRSISHFEHVLREPGHYFHARVSAHKSFAQFMTDSQTRPLNEDFQVRALALQFDPVAISKSLPPSAPALSLERTIETLALKNPDDALLVAKDYLSRAFFVGLTERLDESLTLLGSRLRRPPPPVTTLNENSNRRLTALTLDAEELELVSSLTRRDFELYEFAVSLFEARRAEAER